MKKCGIYKIAIRFSDNDFYSTFTGVLKTLANAFNHCGKLPENKEQLCLVINEISYGHYLLFQNQFKYDDEKNDKICERTKFYLTLESKNILINDEVDEFLSKVYCDNLETHILDLTQHEPFVFSI